MLAAHLSEKCILRRYCNDIQFISFSLDSRYYMRIQIIASRIRAPRSCVRAWLKNWRNGGEIGLDDAQGDAKSTRTRNVAWPQSVIVAKASSAITAKFIRGFIFTLLHCLHQNNNIFLFVISEYIEITELISLINHVALYYFDWDFTSEHFDWQEKEIY